MMFATVVIIISLVLNKLTNGNIRKLILIATSLLVYYAFVEKYIVFLLAESLLCGMLCWIDYRYEFKRPWTIWAFVLVFALALIHFRLDIMTDLVMPVGFSIYSFNCISLLVYGRKNRQNFSFVDYMLFICFFPKILAGPLEKPSDFFRKINSVQNTKRNYYIGIKIILFALLCKVFVADTILSNYSMETVSGINSVVNILIFSLHIYFDFWAYSNIGIGVALLYGYTLPISFKNPYFSHSFHDFWNRWNVTFTGWFRDNIYIPLGGNKVDCKRMTLNIMVVFIVSGLWHGLTLPFVVWGIIHGLFMVFEKFIVRDYIKTLTAKCIYGFLVFFVVSILWQLFLLQDFAEFIMVLDSLGVASALDKTQLLMLFVGAVLYIVSNNKKLQSLFFDCLSTTKYIVGEVVCLTVIVLVLILTDTVAMTPFFYMRF